MLYVFKSTKEDKLLNRMLQCHFLINNITTESCLFFFCFKKCNSYAVNCRWNLSMWKQIRTSIDLDLCLIANNIVNWKFAAGSCSVDVHLHVWKPIFSVHLQCLFHLYHIIVLRLQFLLSEVFIHSSFKNRVETYLHFWQSLSFKVKVDDFVSLTFVVLRSLYRW